MPATKTSLQGGGFQDSEGNALANGYLIMELSQDATVTGVGNIASGIAITIQLDGNGNVLNATSPGQQVWANDVMLPVNTFYRVTGYTAAGQPAWGPNNQQVTGGSPFNLGSWIPNQITSWVPPLTSAQLQTNGVNNSNQALLDLQQGAGVTLAESAGVVTISASAVPIALKTNGTSNGSQSTLNLQQGSGVTLTDNGSGQVTIAAAGTSSSPIGSNVAILPPYASGNGNLGGNTIVLKIPCSMVSAVGTGVKVGILFYTNGSTHPVIASASIGATLPNASPGVGGYTYNYAWTTAPIALTWSGGLTEDMMPNISNRAAITIDSAHDYYVMVYLTSGLVPYSPQGSASNIWTGLGGRLSGDFHNPADASGLQTLASGIALFSGVIIA